MKHLSLDDIVAASYEDPSVVDDYGGVLKHLENCKRCHRLVSREQQTNRSQKAVQGRSRSL